jgi:type IV pilus assembly protein PilQ
MRIKFFLCFVFLLIGTCSMLCAQESNARIESIKIRLEGLSDDIPQLQNKVSFSVSGVSLYEFLRALGTNNKLNLDINPSIDTRIAVNFSNVKIADLLLYLCEQYDLQIYNSGSILSIGKYYIAPPEAVPPPPKVPDISYDSVNGLLSFDLQMDTLGDVFRRITELSGVNIITPAKFQNHLISGYLKNVVIAEAVKELAYINNFTLRIKDSTTFYLEDPAEKPQSANAGNVVPLPAGLQLTTNKKDSVISVYASNVPISDILAAVARELNINYFVFSEIKGSADLKTGSMDFNTFLRYLFNATDFTFKQNNGIYLIGERGEEAIRTVEVYPFQYRTVLKVLEQIPSDLKKGLEMIPVVDMNSLIVAGSNPAVRELKDFLRQIDKVVPVVNIELIILDVRTSHGISTGIMAGLDDKVKTSSYSSVFPNLDMTLSANTINNIIDGINGTGLVNLGKVVPGFYVSLKASEDNGSLKIRSTPRLSTLNGNEAQMTIGETRYYAEQTTNVITTQSTTTVNSRIFKELQANFAIIIKPIVSGDEQITLDISVEQSTFTEQFTKDGPYGRLTRSFKSSLRVKNNDMILLGGLEEKNVNDAGQGLPVLSRIPILKWLFSSRSNSAKKSKLVILIHPTVFY